MIDLCASVVSHVTFILSLFFPIFSNNRFMLETYYHLLTSTESITGNSSCNRKSAELVISSWCRILTESICNETKSNWRYPGKAIVTKHSVFHAQREEVALQSIMLQYEEPQWNRDTNFRPCLRSLFQWASFTDLLHHNANFFIFKGILELILVS